MTPDYRDRLVALLDKLSAASDVERAKAARLVDEHRAMSGLTWDEIIPPARSGRLVSRGALRFGQQGFRNYRKWYLVGTSSSLTLNKNFHSIT